MMTVKNSDGSKRTYSPEQAALIQRRKLRAVINEGRDDARAEAKLARKRNVKRLIAKKRKGRGKIQPAWWRD